MVTLGFFTVAGANNLPYASDDLDGANQVQQSMLAYSSAFSDTAGVRKTGTPTTALCQSCMETQYACSTLYKEPGLRNKCERLAAGVDTSISSAEIVQAWLAAPDAGTPLLNSCASACAIIDQRTNFFAGGFDRPYSVLDGAAGPAESGRKPLQP